MSEVTNVQNYPYTTAAKGGFERFDDGREFVAAYWDGTAPAAAHAGAGSVVAIGNGIDAGNVQNTADQCPGIMAVATLAIDHQLGVLPYALSTAGWHWVQTKGYCPVLNVEGTSAIAVGDYLKGVNGEDYAVIDHASTPTAKAFAVAQEAYAVAAESKIKAYLLGCECTV